MEDLKGIYMNCGKAKMTITPIQQRKFQKATKCWICGDKLVTDKDHQDYEKKQPVRDHCHFTTVILQHQQHVKSMPNRVIIVFFHSEGTFSDVSTLL